MRGSNRPHWNRHTHTHTEIQPSTETNKQTNERQRNEEVYKNIYPSRRRHKICFFLLFSNMNIWSRGEERERENFCLRKLSMFMQMNVKADWINRKVNFKYNNKITSNIQVLIMRNVNTAFIMYMIINKARPHDKIAENNRHTLSLAKMKRNEIQCFVVTSI